MLRFCEYCQEQKPFDPTQAQYAKASGFRGSKCWACHLVSKNVIKQRLYGTQVGRITANMASRTYRATPEGRAKNIEASLAWCKANPGKANAISAKRRAVKLQRTPIWASLQAIRSFYEEAAALGLTVDHFYPLQGALVSGLHVYSNLQMLTGPANSGKKNSMPYHPTENW